MAGGLLFGQPAYVEDMDSPACQDRLLIKSLGVQAGVVEENDCKVTAGAGLQVEVEKGKAFVAQTATKQESSNTFYNGLYNVLNPAKQNPYNAVEVSSANPQIAQIILRVYDVEELGIIGSSYGRIEWLNGSANAGATKAHIEEGKASEFGAAVLPQSSLRLCYVVVPKNATLSSKYTIVDERISSLEITSREIAARSVGTAKIESGLALVETGNAYGAQESCKAFVKYEPNSTRSTLVVLQVETAISVPLRCVVIVGGINVAYLAAGSTIEGASESCSFICPPGVKWEVASLKNHEGKLSEFALFSSYLQL